MKKLLGILFAAMLVFLLGACGNDNASKEEEGNKEEEKTSQESAEEMTEDASEEESSTEEQYSFEGQYGTYSVVGWYYNEEFLNSEDATNVVDFDGFKLNYASSLVDITLNEEAKSEDEFAGKDKVRAILITVSAENTNDFEVDYNGNIKLITDMQEQISSEAGAFAINPVIQTYMGQAAHDGMFYFILDEPNSEPENLKIVFEPPYKVENGAVDTENGILGEQQTAEFDFATQEEMETME